MKIKLRLRRPTPILVPGRNNQRAAQTEHERNQGVPRLANAWRAIAHPTALPPMRTEEPHHRNRQPVRAQANFRFANWPAGGGIEIGCVSAPLWASTMVTLPSGQSVGEGKQLNQNRTELTPTWVGRYSFRGRTL
jgi:hypothetical protein